MYHKT